MKKSPVEIGIEYENRVVEVLQSCGLTAYRTNKANESDQSNTRLALMVELIS